MVAVPPPPPDEGLPVVVESFNSPDGGTMPSLRPRSGFARPAGGSRGALGSMRRGPVSQASCLLRSGGERFVTGAGPEESRGLRLAMETALGFLRASYPPQRRRRGPQRDRGTPPPPDARRPTRADALTRPSSMRQQAERACMAQAWALCAARLDAAGAIDPDVSRR